MIAVVGAGEEPDLTPVEDPLGFGDCRAHVSVNGVHKREVSRASYLGMLVEHVGILGYTVALVPQRHPGARPTGTGWPA